MTGSASVLIPADVARPDRVVFGLTAAQATTFTVAGLAAWGGWGIVHKVCPPLVYAAGCVPFFLVLAVVVLGRRDGVPLAVWLRAAWSHRRAPRRQTWPEPSRPSRTPPPPRWLRARGPHGARGWQRPPAPWQSPARGVDAEGLIDLGPDGTVAVLAASTVTFGLRQPGAQYALLGGFTRCLHGLDAPVQIVVRTVPVTLRPRADRLAADAHRRVTAQLAAAARAHAGWLAGLGEDYELLARHVYVTVRSGASSGVARRAAQTSADLTTAGISAAAVTADEALTLLTDCLNPAPSHPTRPPEPPPVTTPPDPLAPARGGWPAFTPPPPPARPRVAEEGDRW